MSALATLNIKPCCSYNPVLKYLRRPFIIFSIIITFVMLSPLLLPISGLGAELAIITNDSIICSSTAKPGLIGKVTTIIDHVPLIGPFMDQGIILAAISISLLLTANLLSRNSYLFGACLYIAGIFFSLPAILPAISHGMKFLTMLFGYEHSAQLLADFIGKPAQPMAVYSFISSGGVIIAAHLSCIISGIAVIFSLSFRQVCKHLIVR